MSQPHNTPISIAFATYGDGPTGATAGARYSAYASLADVSDNEASDILSRLRRRGGNPIDAIIRGDLPFDLDPETLGYDLLSKIQNRFLVGLHPRVPLITMAIARLILDPVSTASTGEEHLLLSRKRLQKVSASLLASDETFAGNLACIDDALVAKDPNALFRFVYGEDPGIEVPVDHRPKRLVELVDGDAVTNAIEAHRCVWGRLHRLIDTTCESGLRSYVTASRPRRRDVWIQYTPLPNEGFWEAWRSSDPIAFRPIEDSPSLQLARLVAAAALSVKMKAPKCDLCGSALASRSYGEITFSEEFSQVSREVAWSRVEQGSYRAMRWAHDGEDEARLPDALRLARNVVGHDLCAARDRLIFKMTGRGLGVGATLDLRVETLHVDQWADLFDLTWSREVAILKMDDDDAADLWTLVRANETTEGFLFSTLDDDESYGRTKLSRNAYDAIVAARSMAFPSKGCAEDCTTGKVE